MGQRSDLSVVLRRFLMPRWRRSLLATVEITALAALAHRFAGGHLPGAGHLVALAAVVFGCALFTLGRRARVAAVVPVVLVAQAAMHLAFVGTGPVSPTPAAMPGMGAMGTGTSGPAPLAFDPMMLWAHLVTAVIAAIVLLSQERVVSYALSWLLPSLSGAIAVPKIVATDVLSRAVRGSRRAYLGASPRRGPPVLRADAA